jgi:hypothetical protein
MAVTRKKKDDMPRLLPQVLGGASGRGCDTRPDGFTQPRRNFGAGNGGGKPKAKTNKTKKTNKKKAKAKRSPTGNTAPKQLPKKPPSSEEGPRFSTHWNRKSTKDFLRPYLFRAIDGMKKAAVKWHLDLPEVQLDVYHFQGDESTRCGSRVILESQRGHNEANFRLMYHFCAIIGDYESMLMLLPDVPAFCPSMKAETIELGLRFKRQDKNTPLMHTGANSAKQVQDIFGNLVYAVGGWNNPKLEWIYSAGITGLHQNQGHTGESYCEPCQKCMDMANPCDGCVHHRAKPQLRREGDPTKTQNYRNAKMYFFKLGKGHVEKGCSQLLPADVRRLRENLMSEPCLANLQMWTIILTSTLLFLRWDEYHDIKGEDFMEHLFHIPGATKVVEELALEVQGKSDNSPVTLKMVADHEYPELCGVRTLLLYLDSINWKGGYIFPTMKEIHENKDKVGFDGIYKTQIVYSRFNKALQVLIDKVLPGRDLKVGSHIFRKTAFCLAIFGRCNRTDLRKSSRHSLKSKDAPIYEKDAASAYESHCRTPNSRNDVRDWTNIRVEDHSNAQAMAGYAGSDHHLIGDLPEHFRREVLGVGDDHQEKDNLTWLLERAAVYVTGSDAHKQLEDFMEDYSEEKQDELRQLIGRVIVEKRRRESVAARSQEVSSPTAPAPPAAVTPTPRKRTAEEASVSEEQPAKKKAKNNLDEKRELQDKSSEEKATIMLGWKQNRKENGPYTDAAKDFFKKCINPVVNCLENHCSGDVEAFAKKYPNFAHSTFAKRCCKGRGDSCSH